MFRNLCTIWFTMVVMCLGGSLAFAASFSVVSSGNGVYTVQGDGLSSVGGIELTISYDKSSLSAPKVAQGSLVGGGIIMPNENFGPGAIKIAILSTSGISGSGPLAVITFGNHGSGSVQIASSKLIDTSGKSVASGQMDATSSILSSKPGIPFSEPNTSSTSTATPSATAGTTPSSSSSSTATPSSSAATTTQPSSLGTVTMPGESHPAVEAKTAETAIQEPPQQTQAAAETAPPSEEHPVVEKPAEPAPSAEVQQTVYTSILESFRTYQGEKTPAAMMALFDKEVSPSIRQEPAIALSDGKTNVRIIADLPGLAGSSPNFALNGASMVSLKKGDGAGKWILEALPNKNTMNASVTILSGSSVIEYPLTTVSSLVKVPAEESYFADFLKDAAAKSPKRDLNGDGKHDYLDDYIYTALYLIQKGSRQTKK